MKERFNESLKVVNLLIKGEISSLCFYKVKYDEDDCLKDDRVVEVMNYLDGLGHYFKLEDYKSKKFGDGLKLTLVKDGEWIDAQQEYLNCQALFGDFSKEEIIETLNIDSALYSDSIAAITSNKNTRKLRKVIGVKSNVR